MSDALLLAKLELAHAAIELLLQFHPQSPETGAELPPECWAPEYLLAVNAARAAVDKPVIVIDAPQEQSPAVPAGYELVKNRSDTAMHGDLCWSGREWCHIDAVNEYVTEYLAVARKPGKTAERDAAVKAWTEKNVREHEEKHG